MNEQGKGLRYLVNIEETDYDWDQGTITAADIRSLAGFPVGTEIIEVNLETNDEHTLTDSESVALKPGHGFGKKIRFKRG